MAFSRDVKLSSGMRCAKIILILISIMFAVTSVLLVMIGSTIGSIFGDFKLFVDQEFFSPPAVLVVIGFILLAVSIFGVYGAMKQSVLVINIYGVLLFVVFIVEFIAAIAAFIMQTQVHQMLIRTMRDALRNYETNDYVQASVDFMQTGLQCCGIVSPLDWQPYWSENFNLTSADYRDEVYVPASCCNEWSQTMANVCEVQNDYGCMRRMDFMISQSTLLIATGALAVAFVQLLGVLCAFMLAKTLRRNKSLLAARRWQMQQSLGILIPGGKEIPSANSNVSGYVQLKDDPPMYTPSSPSVC